MLCVHWLILAIAVAVSSPQKALETGDELYIQASRVALRAQPAITSAAVGFLTTNTQVRLRGRRGEWCEIVTRSEEQRGFVGCGVLERIMVGEEVIAAKLADPTLQPQERLDWQARAFWAAPSLSRFLATGTAMEPALLDDDTRRREQEQQLPLRPIRAEFEAMKQRLLAGLIASGPIVPSYQTNPRGHDRGYREPLDQARKRVSLPAIRPSHFDENEQPLAFPLGGPFTLTDVLYAAPQLIDALSRTNHAPFRVRILDRARFSDIHSIEGVRGVWDVGRMGVSFDKEARLQAVTPRGRAIAISVQSLTLQVGADLCIRTPLGIRSQVLTGGPLTSATVGWVGKPPVEGKTRVRSHRHDGPSDYDKLVVEDIDLDGDAVPDFSVWAGTYEPGAGGDGYWKAVFANVAGHWTLLAFDTDDDCT